jgi:Phosphotransferase enzyme family
MNRAAAERWICAQVEPVAPIELTHERPWASVLRVPTAAGTVWFKACNAVTAFEPRLTGELARRWPGRVADVLAVDEERGWLLLADAGTALIEYGNPPEVWLEALPPYAELQRGETRHAHDHLAHGVPDLRPAVLPERYEAFLDGELPLDGEQRDVLHRFVPQLAALCAELDARGVAASVQHDDLHHANVYLRGDERRVLDWGDASIAHPFFSLGETFRFLEGVNGLAPDDPWFARLRDAYLEPWGRVDRKTFELAIRVGAFAQAIAWLRQRENLSLAERLEFDVAFRDILGRAVANASATSTEE